MARRPIRSDIHAHGKAEASDRELLAGSLRDAMSRWPTGIAVVAVKLPDRIEAITINSFISVSLDPPLVLVSIAARAAIVPALDDAARFTISMLASDQGRIASMVADRMPGLRKLFDEKDAALQDCVSAIVCATAERHSVGDHVLYVGAVEDVRPGREAAPLLYYSGEYQR